LVARLAAAAALWVLIQTSFKNTKIDDYSKGVGNTLFPAEKKILITK